MSQQYNNGPLQCESSDRIEDIHGRVVTIDTTLQGLVRDLITEIKSFNHDMRKAIVYIAAGLGFLWFVDHFGLDRAEKFIEKFAETSIDEVTAEPDTLETLIEGKK